MTVDEKKTLVNYRLERANESLRASELLVANNLYIPAMNRIYYSMFYAVQALLILNECSFSKHSQVKGYFNREYIKSGIFKKDFGKLFNAVFEYRQKFDYMDLVVPEKEMLVAYLDKANTFVDELAKYIKSKS